MMPLEKQVCSLELSKKLKELGVKKESYWYWLEQMGRVFALADKYEIERQWKASSREIYSAFTVAELGEMMAGEFIGACALEIKKEWWVSGGEWEPGVPGRYKHLETADTEADARAKMLIYLIENKLVNP